MSLEVKRVSELVDPAKLKLKILIYAPTGAGKTVWAGTAPTPLFAACETGHGRGTLSLAKIAKTLPGDIMYVAPDTRAELQQITSPDYPGLAGRETLVLDSLSAMNQHILKAHALSFPRAKGDTPKRAAGVPELDDYGVMGELVRQLLVRADRLPCHLVVTAGLRVDKPDPETPGDILRIGPDLPGQMFLGAPAMFDLVLALKVRVAFKDPKKPETRFHQRYLLTEQDGVNVAKSRVFMGGKALNVLNREEIVDLETGAGTFPDILKRVQAAYAGEAR